MLLSKFDPKHPLRMNHMVDTFFEDGVFFTAPAKNSLPATNIREQENDFRISLAAPGLSKEDFKIVIDNKILTILSEKRKSAETQEDNFTRQEYSYNSFKRSFSLPENIDEEGIVANYENGELVLVVPKREMSKIASREIEIV